MQVSPTDWALQSGWGVERHCDTSVCQTYSKLYVVPEFSKVVFFNTGACFGNLPQITNTLYPDSLCNFKFCGLKMTSFIMHFIRWHLCTVGLGSEDPLSSFVKFCSVPYCYILLHLIPFPFSQIKASMWPLIWWDARYLLSCVNFPWFLRHLLPVCS